jgi:hypothetical protein
VASGSIEGSGRRQRWRRKAVATDGSGGVITMAAVNVGWQWRRQGNEVGYGSVSTATSRSINGGRRRQRWQRITMVVL